MLSTNFYQKLCSSLQFCKDPLFIIGLALRLALIVTILPDPVWQWYIPFLESSIEVWSMDPWQTWLMHGGVVIAFPYGYAMWLFFLPFILIFKLFSIPLAYGYGFSLLAADFALLLILRKLLNTKDSMLLALYWLSPISFIASYFLGYNDIIPIFLLMSAVYLLRSNSLIWSGIFTIASISAKLSMILGLPFFLIYLLHNRNLRQIFNQYLIGILTGSIIFLLPFLFSFAGLSMVANNPDVERIYQLSISLVRNTSIYLVPLAYLLMVYVAWRIKRMNFEIFNAVLGMAFLLVLLLNPSSPGWFIWILPLLVTYQVAGDRAAIFITLIFMVLYIFSVILFVSTQQLYWKVDLLVTVFDLQSNIHITEFIDARLASLIHTALVATGVVLAVRVWRETVIRNDFFRLSRKPFVIGVAGDSGSGKDTFVKAILGLLGPCSVTAISGDDYHLWDRNQPMWQVMTHINPSANDLESFANNIVALTDGRSVRASHYNHETGKMSEPLTIKSNDFIVASGLHALYLPILRECYDLSIYLDIDEDLRRYFKIRRDVIERNSTIDRVLDSLEKRKFDSEKFIRPQLAFADLIFSLRPVNNGEFSNISDVLKSDKMPRLKLVVKSRQRFNELSLKRVLIGLCGLHVDMSIDNKMSELEFIIEGDAFDQDIKMAAQQICPKMSEFLDLNPQWQNGVLGLMQLITLSHINQALTRRFL